MSQFTELFGDTLVGKTGNVTTADALGDCDAVGIYFSAHWCPPCRGFTPVLGKKYEALKAAGKKLEIVFVSSDKDAESFASYHGSMPWLALPFALRDEKAELSSKFGVSGIPMLLFIGKDGEVITTEGRGAVSAASFVEDFPYHPKPLNDLKDGTGGINDKRCLVVLLDVATDAEKAAATAVMQDFATRAYGKKEAERKSAQRFFVATGGPVSQIRKGCGLPLVVTKHPHALKQMDEAGGRWGCDGCGKSGEEAAERHKCLEGCNFDYCGACNTAAGEEPAAEAKGPAMLLLNLGDEGAYYRPEEGKKAVNATNITAFLAAFENGSLTKKQFGK